MFHTISAISTVQSILRVSTLNTLFYIQQPSVNLHVNFVSCMQGFSYSIKCEELCLECITYLCIILYLLLYLYQHCKVTVLMSINLVITVNFERSSYRVHEHGESIAPLLILTELSPCPFIVRAQLMTLGELIDTHMHI